MKRTGRIISGATFLLAFWALVALGDQMKEKDVAKEGPPCDDDFCLTKTSIKGTLHLVYHFKGLNDQWHDVTCDIREADITRDLRSFGYLESERKATWLQYLERAINLGLRISQLKPEYGKAHVTKDSVEWVPTKELPPLVGEQILAEEREAFLSWYRANQEQLEELAKQKFRQDHGFTVVPDLGEVPDYSSIVKKSASALGSCITALDQATGGRPEMLQVFFQVMFYEKVPDNDAVGKWTGGLSLPVEVMTRGKGDCDSKAAAFCTIQRKREPRLVILRSLPGNQSPRHALVGVEAWKKDGSHPAETWSYKRVPEALRAILYGDPIRIGLRDYWPCEVAGRKRSAFGEVELGHEGYYVAIRIQ